MRPNSSAAPTSLGAGPLFRLDPAALPVRCHAAVAGTAPGAPASVLIETHQIVIRGTLPSGVPVALVLPIDAFRGVAVRMVPAGVDAVRIVLELLHEDPALSIPLAVSAEPGDVVADWQSWAKALGRPLVLVSDDGTVVEPVRRMGGVELGTLKPRRHHSFFADRRPRFLTRRKVGRRVPIELVEGLEITAPDAGS